MAATAPSPPCPAVRIGVDLGGTKIETIAMDAAGSIIHRRRAATPRESYDGILRAIAAEVAAADEAVATRLPEGQAPVGVGIPGTVSPATGLIKNANTSVLIGRPFDRDLADMLGRPVRLANDADCFTLSEASDGAGAGAKTVFGIIVGTGTGGGLVVAGALVRGPNAITGEWGHNPLPWPSANSGELPGPPCYCGKRGCIETFLSGPGLEAAYAAQAGHRCTAQDIASRADAGEAEAAAVMSMYVDRFARSLATVINVIDPDIVVLGGGVSNIARLYDELPAALPKYVFSDTVITPVVKARHGDASGVRGAAWLWP